MYPTITDLLEDLLGIYIPLPIQSFGFFVALAFLSSSYFLMLDLKRKEKEGLLAPFKEKVLVGAPPKLTEVLLSGLMGFVLGYKLIYALINYSDFVASPDGMMLSFDGSMPGGILCGIAYGYYKYWEKNKAKLDAPKHEESLIHPYQQIGNIVMIAAIAGILGAKLFHNLENLDDLLADPVGALLSFSGLTFYGGLICGSLAVLYYTRSKGIATVHLLDAAGPALMLAYGVGRIGCQVAGDGDWGIYNELPQPDWLLFAPEWVWAYDYPNNVLGIELPAKVFPTPLYEAVLCIVMFGVLWLLRKRIQIAGALFSIYLILNGVERFFIEKIRVNEIYTIIGREITQAEIISSLLVLLGIWGIWYSRKRAARIKNPLDL